ncbi:MAG: SUF system NifU family Fe-S cluster assembly protein [Planctomycetes bacterium]|nr:SUF system NifU family Fe-S cluster assembly protein [Planctomycetota bacterium]
MSLESLYQEIIMEHFKAPRNRGEITTPDVSISMNNPFCGDEITLHLSLQNGRIADVKFRGRGCAISQASASLMTELFKGLPLANASTFASTFKKMMRGEAKSNETEPLGDLVALEGVRKFPVRVKCALLAWSAFEEGVKGKK